jgi:hypothetical protein
MSKDTTIVHYRGSTSWADDGKTEHSRVAQASLAAGKTLILEIEGRTTNYHVNLNRTDGDCYDGEWSWIASGENGSGKASAILYTSSAGLLLFGYWHEEGRRNYWWTELSQLEG